MPRQFPRFQDGDELEPFHLNIIYRELERWRKLHGTGLIGVDRADSEDAPAVVDYRPHSLIPAQLTSGITAGSMGTPSSAAGTLLVPSGSAGGWTATGGAAATIYNLNTTAITGTNKFCWVTPRNGLYYLVVADC